MLDQTFEENELKKEKKMKTVIKMISLVALLAMVVSCATTATTSVDLPDKYNLEGNLRSVSQISAVGVSNWSQVDGQSLMATANGKFYLFVLDKPLETMDAKVGFIGSLTSIRTGYSKIYVGTSSDRRFYSIAKMFELSGVDQAKEIKASLGNN